MGVWGDQSCPELAKVVHCHNCPVFASAGRDFLSAPSPADYREEWTARLAEPETETADDLHSVLVFRIGGEWLALSVQTLVEVTSQRPVHRIPFRSGLLAGLVNVRGELYLAVRVDQLLGIRREADHTSSANPPRLLVVRQKAETWIFPVDEVDRFYPVPGHDLAAVPPTLARATARFTRGVFRCAGRAVGYLDEGKLFEALRTRVR
jgi:chemotaxis-related protein WspD